jgi:V/A-type H+/Na+-transporting ATPase subunit E
MKHLDSGSEKIKKICDAIRHETLEPAKQQAKAIVEQASDQAANIIQEARNQAESIMEASKLQYEKEKQIFEASMIHSSKLFKEKLKQEIEQHFLVPSLDKIASNIFNDAKMTAQVVSAIVEGWKKQSASSDLVAIVSSGINKEEFAKALTSEVRSRMMDIKSQDSISGVILKSQGENLRIEISQNQLAEALMNALRQDFRKFFYQGS